ncbi:MAG TPA: YraN family protein [Candidatus Babeliaceae bacterium]|nr:YraN family protein [Candidatus Babeliaceae bacterium]
MKSFSIALTVIIGNMRRQQKLGAQGEHYVAQFLEKQGFTIVALNYRQRYGEIDIVATKGDLLAFVEVKARSQILFSLSEVVTVTKQRKIIKTALQFIRQYEQARNKIWRFDVALVDLKNEKPAISYIPNAFTSS